jgi:hypothetical protein
MTVSRKESPEAFVKPTAIDVRGGVDINADTEDVSKGS